jgi:TraM recognition site of TraD and TraG
MLCDEIGNLGRIDAFLTAATLLRSWGFTLWTFWQNLAQLQIWLTCQHPHRQRRSCSGFLARGTQERRRKSQRSWCHLG